MFIGLKIIKRINIFNHLMNMEMVTYQYLYT